MAGTLVWGKLLGSRSEIGREKAGVTVDRVDRSRVFLNCVEENPSGKVEDGFLLSKKWGDVSLANRTAF
jgi:hypothetical protein